MLILLFAFLPLTTDQYVTLSDYGQPCNNFIECKDHRMHCKGEGNNMTCVCINTEGKCRQRVGIFSISRMIYVGSFGNKGYIRQFINVIQTNVSLIAGIIEIIDNERTLVRERYHEWKGFDQGCVQMYDGEKLMRLEVFFNNVSEEIARKQDKVFSFQLWAGGFVVAVYIVAILAVVSFCVYVRSADTAMHHEINMLKLKVRRDTLLKQKTLQASA